MVDGFVLGINNFVVNTATIFTYMGENLFNFLESFSCTGRSDINGRNDNNLCRRLRYNLMKRIKRLKNFILNKNKKIFLLSKI